MSATRESTRSSRPTSPKQTVPAATKALRKTKVNCPICLDPVEDSMGKKKGHDSIFCDGYCQEWLHRQCAGLSKSHFQSVSASSDPFLCPKCIIAKQSSEIRDLQQKVNHLADRVSVLESLVANKPGPDESRSDQPSEPPEIHTDSSVNFRKPSTTSAAPPNKDRKFNIILYGIEEPQKAGATIRKMDDLKRVESVIQSVGANRDSVRDCVRLGKFKPQASKPRPILANLTRVSDVQEVLSKVNRLSKPIVIKPDLSLQQRKIESILLKERWSLIQQGQPRSTIKIRNSKLYVDNSLYGSSNGTSFNIAHNTLNLNLSSESLQNGDDNPSTESDQPTAPSRHQQQPVMT